jgi:hypothetical protein
MAASLEGFRKGLSHFSGINRPLKNWVTSEFIRKASSHQEVRALDDFLESVTAARTAIRTQGSVFLSHSNSDKRFVRPLATYIESHGLRVWLDEVELHPGEPLMERLAAAVGSSTLVLAILSRKAVRSNWVKKELSLAITQEIKGRRIKVISIIKEKCRIPAFLEDKLHLDFSSTTSRTENRPVLIDSLMRHAAAKRLTRR